ncbi:ArgS-related anticodon-binding protein NrtL [Streptomyces sp. NPDC101230]|uniref:ArgS-related anticodon-binding protein NrtL n=1 Tax=unclassified Streptomyces TaxID=2593676 RepID=UPI0037F89CB2
MTPADLSRTVLHAVRRAVDESALHAPVPARVRVERTRPGGSGDYACAVALQLAGPAGLPALEVARILRERVAAEPGIGRVEITGPGFLSFTVDTPADSDRAVLDAVREQGVAYGHGDALRDEEIRLAHAPEVRAAVTADAVRRLLAAQGARVQVGCEEAGEADTDAWRRLGVAPDADWAAPDAYGAAPDAYGAAPDAYGAAADAYRAAPDAYGAAPDAHGAAADAYRAAADAHGAAPDAYRAAAPDPLGGTVRPVPAGATAAELLERLGADAARWGLLRPAAHDRAPLGDDLLVQGEANPLFRVRYAHARARALTRNAADLGFTSEPAAHEEPAAREDAAPYAAHEQAGPSPYTGPARPLLHLLADHPRVLLAAARHRAPDRVARQLEAVAHAFFDFHDGCPPLPSGDEKPSAAHRSRLALAEAAGTVLAGGLSLLGISAPAHL